MTTLKIEKLPPDWSEDEQNYLPDCAVLRHGGKFVGWVTVDFERRNFALGIGRLPAGRPQPTGYIGRGWKDRLVADAIAHLTAVYTKPTW